MSENRHDALDLIEQEANRGRIVYGLKPAPGAIDFENTRPMQWLVPARERPVSFWVIVWFVFVLAVIGGGNIGLYVLARMGL